MKAAKFYKDRYVNFCRTFEKINDFSQGGVEIYATPASFSFRVSEDLKGDPKYSSPFEVNVTLILFLRAGVWALLFFGVRKLIRKRIAS